MAPGLASLSGWEPKKLWRQLPDGKFEELAAVEGFDSRADGRALVAIDLDGDGDQDLLMMNRAAPRLQVFRNDHQDGSALELRLRGKSVNRDGEGARVWVESGGAKRLFPAVLGRGYASAVDPRIHVGLGDAFKARVSVEWRPGELEELGELTAGASYLAVQGEKVKSRQPFRKRSSAPQGALPTRLEVLGVKADPARPTVATLFASWCEACGKEAPALNALASSGRATVVGLGVADTLKPPAAAKKLGLTIPVRSLDLEKQAALFVGGSLQLPLTLLYGKDGRLFRVVRSAEALEAALRELEAPAP